MLVDPLTAQKERGDKVVNTIEFHSERHNSLDETRASFSWENARRECSAPFAMKKLQQKFTDYKITYILQLHLYELG